MNRKLQSAFVKSALTLSLVLTWGCCSALQGAPEESLPEIHSKHFLFGYPSGTPFSNDLIIRDGYALSSNDRTKLADWVAWRLESKQIYQSPSKKRRWMADPYLTDEETLEPDDYRGAHRELKTDRGHMAPLGDLKNLENWYESNYLSNIAPQDSALNQGPWRVLEERTRELVMRTGRLYIVCGPVYESGNRKLPGADEEHAVPDGYWKVIAYYNSTTDELRLAPFLFMGTPSRRADPLRFIVDVDTIESRTGLDLFRLLPDDREESLESTVDREWILKNLR